jgi:hypothetical protein
MSDLELPRITPLLRRVTAWARRRPDVRGLALVGSWARGAARPDSDVDLVLLTDDPAAYVGDAGWVGELGAAGIVRTRAWGVLTERRLLLGSGLQIDLGVVRPAWALTEPVDAGTRKVVSDGMRVLYDPDGRLSALAVACRAAGGLGAAWFMPARRLGAAGSSGRARRRWTRRC